jgi:hypothetical protein
MSSRRYVIEIAHASPEGEAWATYLDDSLRATMQGYGFWIGTSEQTPEETVAELVRYLVERQS